MSERVSRRKFLKTSAAATASVMLPSGVFAQGSSQLKIGLIGCGGRGTGAAIDAVNASKDVVIWAMADVFAERIESCAKTLEGEAKDAFKATSGRRFLGFEAYKALLATDCDVVILATPPGFRPGHLKAAVEAGKHIFTEKPVAVDPAGIRIAYAASELAVQKKLNIVAGTQRRHDVAYCEAMKRIHDGAIGDIVACYAYWNQGGLWMHPRQEKWSDMEWQLRNWLYFTWLSGDHIVEQHVHNLDVCNWAMGSEPVKAVSLGGRQVRTNPAYGHIFDHFATEYEYANGVKMVSMCRQIDGTASRVSEHLVGSNGTSNANTSIRGKSPWRFEGDRPNPYVEEHRHLFEAIKSGKLLNEGSQVTGSTLTAIMGRIAAYTGQEVTRDQILNSTEDLMPVKLDWGHLEVPAVAMPGTKVQA